MTPALVAPTPPSLRCPSLLWGAEPPPPPRGFDALWDAGLGALRRARRGASWALQLGDAALRERVAAQALADAQLDERIDALRVRAMRGGAWRFPEDAQTLGALAEAARRTLGLSPRREQLACAAALLHGSLVELPTGEGKTLAVALAGAALAWRGRSLHILTANDYLAQRDAQAMAPFYARVRVRVGVVQEGDSVAQRRQAHGCDATYLTAREAAADTLRDLLALAGLRSFDEALLADGLGAGRLMAALLTRGQSAAIVDEADAALLDDAGAPLVLADRASQGPDDERAAAAVQAARIAERLVEGVHHRYDETRSEVYLTRRGERAIDELCASLDGLWRSRRAARELVVLALEAQRKARPGVEYVVRDGAVALVDEATGRLAPERSWRGGLHQAVEAQEGLAPSPLQRTLARMSFQRFFRRYQLLSGVTATAWEARGELWRIYRLPVVRLPAHKPCVRVVRPLTLHPTAAQRDAAAAQEAAREHAKGRPVLLTVASVRACDRLSDALSRAGVPHNRLSAVDHEREAEVVAQAGRQGSVTLATNMAGRGTDIVLDAKAKELGGLLVIVAEPQRSRRLDRQLFGRCARQGEPGEAAPLASLEDELLTRHLLPWERRLARLLTGMGAQRSRLLGLFVSLAQQRASRRARQAREAVLRADVWLEERLAFAQGH